MEQENKWIRDIQRGGSRQATEKLVERYYDEIYVFVYRQTGHKEDAMDLTQSIFLAVLLRFEESHLPHLALSHRRQQGH